jgi:hypothetical protein
MIEWDFSQGGEDVSINMINMMHYIKWMKAKNNMIITIDVENTFNKIQYYSL